MNVEAIALTDFFHDDITAHEGKLVRNRNGTLIDSYLAHELERHGLVRIRSQPSAAQPAVKAAGGKAPDDGAGQPSSASQAAPALQPMTSSSLKTGSRTTRKPDA